jgi:hypothetical protein
MRRSRLLALLFATALALGATALMATPASAGINGFFLKNQANGLCLQPTSPAAGAEIIQTYCKPPVDYNSDQGWSFYCLPGTSDCSKLRNHGGSGTLCLRSKYATNGGRIELWPCNWISDENWNRYYNNAFLSRVGGTSTHCLDVPGGQPTVGLHVQAYRCNGTTAQAWLTPVLVN